MSIPPISRRPWLAAALVAVTGARAGAQVVRSPLPPPAAPVTAPDSAPPAGTFLFSVGTDISSWDNALARSTPGVAVQAGYQRRVGPAGSRFAARVSGDYWRSSGGTYQRPNEFDVASPHTFRRNTSIVGGSVLGVMNLRTSGIFRPYALGGGGVYQYSGVNQTALPNGGPTVVDRPGERITSFAYNVGLGSSLRVGPVTPFTEFRLIRLTSQEMQNNGTSSLRMPVSVGARIKF